MNGGIYWEKKIQNARKNIDNFHAICRKVYKTVLNDVIQGDVHAIGLLTTGKNRDNILGFLINDK